jgi:hypothetical protein
MVKNEPFGNRAVGSFEEVAVSKPQLSVTPKVDIPLAV